MDGAAGRGGGRPLAAARGAGRSRRGGSDGAASRPQRAPGRDLARIDQRVLPPADAQEPGPRRRHRRLGAEQARRRAVDSRVLAPPIEPAPRRRGIDHPRGRERLHGLALLPQARDPLRRVPARVEQHVGERVPHLPRARQHLVVIAVREHLPAAPAPERAIHGVRELRRDRLHPAPERRDAVGLDDQMHVIVLRASTGRAGTPSARTRAGTPPRRRARSDAPAATESRAARGSSRDWDAPRRTRRGFDARASGSARAAARRPRASRRACPRRSRTIPVAPSSASLRSGATIVMILAMVVLVKRLTIKRPTGHALDAAISNPRHPKPPAAAHARRSPRPNPRKRRPRPRGAAPDDLPA